MRLISIVVPTYNQCQYLPLCLDSIWFQDYPELEIIVVDDCSTDNTCEVLSNYKIELEEDMASFASYYNEKTNVVERTFHGRYKKEGRTLKVLRKNVNQGLSAALNTGINEAKGEYCSFIASDDILLPSMCTDLFSALVNVDADFAYADMHIVNDSGRILRKFSLPEYSFESSFCDWYLCGVCKLYKKALHDKFGLYSTDFVSQDHEMYLRFAMGGAKFVHVPKVLANVRFHGDDRKVENHSPGMESRQQKDSINLVKLARQFAGGSDCKD